MKPNKRKKTVCIIGGNSGIGKAAAACALRRGDDVIITGRDQNKLSHALKELQREVIQEEQLLRGYSLDVLQPSQLDDFFSKIVHISLDILIYSAGFSYPGYCEQVPRVQFHRQIHTNLIAAGDTAMAAFPLLKKSRGKLVFISSLAGFMGVFGYAGYGASKGGLNVLAETLRVEWKRFGIGVKLLCPPDTDTPMIRNPKNEKPAETLSISGAARLYLPQYIADILFKGLDRKGFFIVPGFMARLTWRLHRFFPNLLFRIMDKDAKKVQRKAIKES